jgi:hypothetical protein
VRNLLLRWRRSVESLLARIRTLIPAAARPLGTALFQEFRHLVLTAAVPAVLRLRCSLGLGVLRSGLDSTHRLAVRNFAGGSAVT